MHIIRIAVRAVLWKFGLVTRGAHKRRLASEIEVVEEIVANRVRMESAMQMEHVADLLNHYRRLK